MYIVSVDGNNAYNAASVAASAIASDPNYCTSVGQVGSAVNTAVHAFKAAWNAWYQGGDPDSPSYPVPINTGRFEPVVAAAMAGLLGGGPAGCSGLTPPPRYREAPGARFSLYPTLGAPPQGSTMYPTAHLGLGAGAASADANAAYDAASNAANAMAADSNYCASVHTVGSAVNTAVHNFKVAYNAWVAGGDPDSPSTPLPINTGNYEPVVASALQALLGGGPTGCTGVTPPPPAQQVTCADGSTHPAGFVCPPPAQPVPAATTTTSYLPWVLGGVAVLAVGAVALVAASKNRPGSPAHVRRMMARRHPANRRLTAHRAHA